MCHLTLFHLINYNVTVTEMASKKMPTPDETLFERMAKRVLFAGDSEIDQLHRIFRCLRVSLLPHRRSVESTVNDPLGSILPTLTAFLNFLKCVLISSCS